MPPPDSGGVGGGGGGGGGPGNFVGGVRLGSPNTDLISD